MDYAYYILIAIPIFIATMIVEFLIGKKHGKKLYTFNDSITNLTIGIGNQVIGLFIKILILWLYVIIYENFSLISYENKLTAFLVGTILFDFIFYWAHRWGHEINIFWGAHIVHHQSEQYNLSVALRQSWFHNLLSFWMFIPIAILGVDPVTFMAVSAVSILYQYWIHTKLIGKLGWLEYILNTPSAHRVHHATNPDYLDKNYGAIFIIWDRMFGTYQEEIEEPSYGITKPFLSWNPIWANIHFFKELFQYIKKHQENLLKLLITKGPADLNKDKLEQIDKTFFKIEIQKKWKFYVFLNFSFSMLGLAAFMLYFEQLAWIYRIALGTSIIWTIWSCGKFLEQKSIVKILELPRILIAAVFLNLLYYFEFSDWWNLFVIISSIIAVLLCAWFVIQWRNTNLQIGSNNFQ